ncbi:DMT family transporter [Stenotrophomonas sp. ATCM1_4]|uniref:DMT family transporter n=1 Tax=Stenotrophomonas capsici TaxID=3110230 RepID=A0ABU5UZK7_9GAMM|nr:MULTISPECIES: DMT family transporter [unclassified Stenotrophomonas]MEA5666502.1 DMT family transporter [Stenotrophomonas sp. MH1]TDB27971.1 DMT family transporter [Stenotrophomonas sp. ATCM1_4]
MNASTGASALPTRSRRLLISGLLLAGMGAIAASGKAVIVKLAYRHGADATTLLALRMLIAFPFFIAMGLWAARRAQPLSWGDRGRVVLLGFSGYYLSSYLDFLGLQYISATLERLILYLSPTLVVLIALVVLKHKPTRTQVAALLVSYLGVLLAFGHDIQLEGQRTLIGSALVFASALSYAVYLFGSGQAVARIGAVRLTAYASMVACVLCIGQYLLLQPWSGLWSQARPVYGLSLINGTVCTVLPVLAIMIGVKRIGSSLAAQVSMLGPVSTIVLSVWLLDEPMGLWQSAGTVLVLLGVLLVGSGAAKRR